VVLSRTLSVPPKKVLVPLRKFQEVSMAEPWWHSGGTQVADSCRGVQVVKTAPSLEGVLVSVR